MSRIELKPQVGDDLDRIFDPLAEHDVDNVTARIDEIIQAISVLEHSPFIGRHVDGDKRELIIGRRSRRYVALYRFAAEIDTAFVLALHGQREAGYSG